MLTLSLPPELTALEQWVPWRHENNTKIPYRAPGYRASSIDPRSWTSFKRAVELWQSHPDYFSGIGFVFTTEDPFCGIDLDNCFPSGDEPIASWAAGIAHRFADTYAETSPSGRGSAASGIRCRASSRSGPECRRARRRLQPDATAGASPARAASSSSGSSLAQATPMSSLDIKPPAVRSYTEVSFPDQPAT